MCTKLANIVDVVLSAKMARLFRGKRQQEVQNGTKRAGSITNLKTKVGYLKSVANKCD